MEQIHLKLKEDKSVPYMRRMGTTRLSAENHKSQAFDGQTARLALASGDFELADPAVAEITLAGDFPSRDLLAKNGFLTPAAVEGATDDELLEIDGIGKKSLAAIRAAAPRPQTPAADQAAGEGETE